MQKGNLVQSAFSAAKDSFLPLVVVAALALGATVATYRAIAPRTSQPAYGEITPPIATTGATLFIDREEAELGLMTLNEVRSASFQLKNTGTQPVEISQVRTSCMCALAEIAMPAGKSPAFNMAMHNGAAANAWKGLLMPREEALVTVTYDPSLMPVEGSIARNVKFATNDPQNPVVELGVHATVKGGGSAQ